ARNYIARWNGSSFSALGFGVSAPVYALAVFDDGSGPALYAGGDFLAPLTSTVLPGPNSAAIASGSPHIAKWNGTTWSGVGTGTNGVVRALAVHGGTLVAGGD